MIWSEPLCDSTHFGESFVVGEGGCVCWEVEFSTILQQYGAKKNNLIWR